MQIDTPEAARAAHEVTLDEYQRGLVNQTRFFRRRARRYTIVIINTTIGIRLPVVRASRSGPYHRNSRVTLRERAA